MSNTVSHNPFADFDKAFGLNRYGDTDVSVKDPGIDPNTVDALSIIAKNATGDKGLDTKPVIPKSTTDKLPEYWKPYEEQLNSGFEFSEDKTDYSRLATEHFGPEFAHLNTRDLVYDHAITNHNKENFLANNKDYQEVVRELSRNIPDGDYLREWVTKRLTSGENALTVTETMLKEKIAEFFDEGTINNKGKELVSQLRNRFKNDKERFEADASKYANDELKKFKEYRFELDKSIDSLDLFGIELNDEMRRQIKENIYKSDREDPNAPVDNKVKARKQILTAIATDEKLFAKILRSAEKRAEDYGVSVKGKSMF